MLSNLPEHGRQCCERLSTSVLHDIPVEDERSADAWWNVGWKQPSLRPIDTGAHMLRCRPRAGLRFMCCSTKEFATAEKASAILRPYTVRIQCGCQYDPSLPGGLAIWN